MSGPVVIVETGVANTASVVAAVRRCGCECELSRDAGAVRRAAWVVLPGVGSFGAGMRGLRADGLDEAVVERVGRDRPLLAICLGMQMLCEESEESPGVAGLGCVSGEVRRFREGVRTPQFGWNLVRPAGGFGSFGGGYAYFANSYRLAEAPAGWEVAWADHGGRFVAAMERGTTLACQFHPELSGAWGRAVLSGWLGVGMREGVGRC